jgi:hypothetical protein
MRRPSPTRTRRRTDDAAPDQAEELLIQALEAFARAEDALRNGDLAGYQREVAQAQRLLERAAEAQGVSVEELFAPEDDNSPTRTCSRTSRTTRSGEPADEAEDGMRDPRRASTRLVRWTHRTSARLASSRGGRYRSTHIGAGWSSSVSSPGS